MYIFCILTARSTDQVSHIEKKISRLSPLKFNTHQWTFEILDSKNLALVVQTNI